MQCTRIHLNYTNCLNNFKNNLAKYVQLQVYEQFTICFHRKQDIAQFMAESVYQTKRMEKGKCCK